MFQDQEAATISEPAGISLCCDTICLWTVSEEDSCSGDLHHCSKDKTEGENVDLLSSLVLCVLLSPTCALGFHIHLGLVLILLSPSNLLHFDDLLSSPSSSRRHLKTNLCVCLCIWLLGWVWTAGLCFSSCKPL